MAENHTPKPPVKSNNNSLRLWYLRIIAALAPFVIAMETYQITSQFETGGVDKINVIDVLLVVAWGFIFVKFTVPFAERLIAKLKK